MTERETLLAQFEGFDTWADVLAHISAGGRVHYHAPMNYLPVSVESATVKGNVVVVGAQGSKRDRSDKFIADEGHLSRFLRRKPSMTG